MAEINTNLCEQAESDFAHHILLENNERILFSGPFGVGKTTFLKYFFDSRSTEYNVIRLTPVNYVISSNEDIFKYIKYDILRTLIESGRLQLDQKKFATYETLPFFIETEYPKIVRSILIGASKVKLALEGLGTVSKDLASLWKKVEEHNSKANETENKASTEFLKSIESGEGSIYEMNLITDFINSGLEDQEKQNVLVIDDLDRIDPGHIFRLLNVFAAQIDQREEGSKFGFDKIILVCDINNIRNIFSAKYGTKTDFNGYIDKFYSRRVHYFDNRKDLRKILKSLIKGIAFDNNDALLNDFIRRTVEDELYQILSVFVMKGLCNLRSILKFKRFDFRNKTLEATTGLDVGTERIISAIVLDLLLGIFGDKERLIELLGFCVNKQETISMVNNDRLKHILILTKLNQHKHCEDLFEINDLGHVMKFKIEEYGRGHILSAKKTEHTGGGIHAESENKWLFDYNLFQQYIIGIKILEDNGALN